MSLQISNENGIQGLSTKPQAVGAAVAVGDAVQMAQVTGGIGQTYQWSTTSTPSGALVRAINTTYTNNTGHPLIVVSTHTATGNASTLAQWKVAGVSFRGNVSLAVTGSYNSCTFTVPIGATYEVNDTPVGGAQTQYSWAELR